LADTTVDFGIGNTTRYFSVPGVSIPDDDWALGSWGRIETVPGTGYGFIASLGSAGGSETLQMYLQDNGPDYSLIVRYRSNGVFVDYTTVNFPHTGSTNLLFLAQRVADEIQAYVVELGDTVSAPGASNDITGALGVPADTLYIGTRSDIDTGSMWANPFGEVFFLSGANLSYAQIEDIAAGAHAADIAGPLTFDLRMRTSNDPEPDVSGNGYDADQHGSGWTLTDEFFPDGATELNISAETGAFTLTGVAAAVRAQRKVAAAAGAFNLAGQAINFQRSRRMPAAVGAFTLAGQPIGLLEQHVLHAVAGSFALTGISANLHATRRLPISAGSFALTGTAINLTHVWRLNAQTGAFALTGVAIGLAAQRKAGIGTASFALTGNDVALTLLQSGSMTADTGVFALTGNAAGLRTSRRLPISAGAFVLAGNAAALSRQYRLNAATGVFTLSGVDVALPVDSEKTLAAEPAVFTLNGQPVNIATMRKLPPAVGAFSLSGNAAAISRDRVLKAGTGAFVLSGERAKLVYSGATPSTGADRGGVSEGVSSSIWERCVA
jgi:hypothetical protein